MLLPWLAALILFFAPSLSGDDGNELPPDTLINENLKKASLIAEGKIESTWARLGVTVATFRIERCYRGPCKAGGVMEFASFKEQDRYPEGLLSRSLIVFMRSRQSRYRPPAWETATDLSEFVSTPALRNMLSKPKHGKRDIR